MQRLARVGSRVSQSFSLLPPSFEPTYQTRRAFTSTMSEKHSFTSVGQNNGAQGQVQLHGIVFDMDGTLCEPQNWMFGEMRSAVGIPKGSDILDYIHALPEKEQTDAFLKIRAIESEAMGKQIPQPGLVALLEYLDRHGIKKAICTRNFDAPVVHLLENHVPSSIIPFSPIITRAFRPPKPSPEGILHICREWGIDVGSSGSTRPLPIVMVGDSVDDMAAGRSAGALTVLLKSRGKEELVDDERTDVTIDRLDDLITLLESGLTAR